MSLNFSLFTRGLLSESNDKETLDYIKYTLVIFMSTSTKAICQPKTLYESITLYVSIIPRAKNLYQTNTYVINPIGLFFL